MAVEKISPRVKRVANLIRRLSPEERAQLAHLMSDLEAKEPKKAVDDFHRKMLVVSGTAAPSLDEPFIGGLTYREYCALSEAEEKALWDRLFADEEMEIDDFEEVEVQPAITATERCEKGQQTWSFKRTA